jgi:hypothetical protein
VHAPALGMAHGAFRGFQCSPNCGKSSRRFGDSSTRSGQAKQSDGFSHGLELCRGTKFEDHENHRDAVTTESKDKTRPG